MKKSYKILLSLVVWGFLAISCTSSESSNADYEPLNVTRLDKAVYNYSNLNDNERRDIDNDMAQGISTLTIMLNMGHPIDSAFSKYVTSEAVKVFSPEVFNKFADLKDIESSLGGVKVNLEKELPSIKMCNIYSIVSPYRQSIFIADSTLLLALNHYLGANHKVYEGFETYVKKTKEPKFIPYDVVEAIISTEMPYQSDGDNELLSRMLYAGVVTEAKMRIVPNASVSLSLGYEDEELNWLEENQKEAWNSIVSKELLYSTSYMEIEQLLSLSPKSSIIHPQAPGRAGRYFGYKIIRAYLEKNPSTTLSQLLSPQFYKSQKTLIESGYQGK